MSTTMPKSTEQQITELKARSADVIARMKADRLNNRFLLGSQTETRLKKSLAAVERLDLVDTTLLTPEVHKRHAAKLTERYLAHWVKIRDKRHADWLKIPTALRRGTPALTDAAVAGDHMRFFTLIDCVTVVDADAALQAAMRMKAELTSAVEAVKGIHCLGAIEAEVINLSIMRTIREKDTNAPSEKRKLDVCDVLAMELDGTLYSDQTNLFLVHFHGVLTAKETNQFEGFRNQLQTNARWSRAPRQIEIKKLSEEFSGKSKTVAQNLQHIATYITKGGNDWVGGSIALRYKLGLSKSEDGYDEVSDMQTNWRRSEVLRAEHQLDGIVDSWSLTVNEVAQLALFIDMLMGSNRTRTGYLVNAKS